VRRRAKVTIDSLYGVVCEELIGTKMNDLDFCLQVVYGHVNHCFTFAIEYLGNRQNMARDEAMVPTYHKEWPMESRVITLTMMSRDPERSSRHSNTLRSQYLKSNWRCYLTTITNY